MKILMVNKFLYPKGGSETYMFTLSEHLRKAGHSVRFFGMHDDRNIVDTDKDLLVGNLNFHSKSLSRLLYPLKVLYSKESRIKIGKMLQDFRPDIVHLHNYNFQLTPSIIYEIRNRGIPMVQTVHDPVIVCPSHMMYSFSEGKVCEKCKGHKYLNCMKGKCIHGSLVKSILGTFEGYLYHKLSTYDHIDTLICPSQFMADKIIEFGIPKEKVSILHNFSAVSHNKTTAAKKEQVLYFGRLTKEKGIETLLKAAGELKDIRFVFAGEGPLKEELSKFENVEYMGFKTGAELNTLIRESLFTVCPSEWYENCPMAVLESQGLGTPVIGAKIGGIPELIDPNATGLLFEPGNKDDLVQKIKMLYNNREMLSKMSGQCLVHATKFNIEKHYDQLFKIYNNAIQNRKARR